MLNRLDQPTFSAVAGDHHQCGRMVGEYFLKAGHDRVAFLAEEHDWGAEQRIEGLRAALEAAGSSLHPELVLFTEHQPLYGALRQLLAQKPSALFLAGEDLALEGTFLLTDMLQVKVPDELSLIGLENAKVSQFTRPPLTTVCQPLQQIAQDALRMVLDQIDRDSCAPEQTLLDNSIIERESVSSPRQ